MSPPNRTSDSGQPLDFIGSTPLAVPIQPTHPTADFDSGEQHLDTFLRRHALSNDERGIGKTYVLLRSPVDPTDLPTIIGFYTLSMAAVESKLLRRHERDRLPAYDLPIALLGRLAIDLRAQRRGFGKVLLVDALGRIAAASLLLGCLGVAVDAKNQAAHGFYQGFGFVELADTGWPRRLYLPMSTVWQLVSTQDHG